MKNQNALKKIAALVMWTPASASFSNDGHGMAGSHWHATDVWGWVALGGIMALAIWLSRGGK